MNYIIICLVALIGSGLTLFSGFGLGTILVPVFGIFFPIEIAITLTAIAHFLNNIFKLFLVGKYYDKDVLLHFGIPSLLAAFVGAWVLTSISDWQSIYQYSLSGKSFFITPVKVTIAGLMILFALFELIPKFSNLEFDKKYLSFGGVLSGFFGGLSGNQGALRSAFLVRANLNKESIIGTGVIIACLVDVSRLTVYSQQIFSNNVLICIPLVAAATLSAFVGAYFGNKLLKKVTLSMVQNSVAIMLLIFALLLGFGIV